jgi:hypothetical protein
MSIQPPRARAPARGQDKKTLNKQTRGYQQEVRGRSKRLGDSSRYTRSDQLEVAVLKQERPWRRKDLSGQRFGRLVAVRDVGSNGKRRLWECRCDCGNISVVDASNLVDHTRSCGCLKSEIAAKNAVIRSTTHGYSPANGRTPTYNSWQAMKGRCLDVNHHAYARYGGCGITVCERWMEFENFLADMGERPAGKTLDRHPDPFGGYEPTNCRWATPKEQQHNRRDRVL